MGLITAAGVASRGVYDGVEIERDKATRYRTWSTATAGPRPRTSRMLRDLAEPRAGRAARLERDLQTTSAAKRAGEIEALVVDRSDRRRLGFSVE